MPDLISDGGSMTVGRRTASWTWGAFDVVLLEGDEQVEGDGRLADGYIYRPDDRERGRFDLTFVRADVRIDLNSVRSDLEATLDGASRRTSGDAFYTRELTGPSLGRKRPGVDYDVGDVVDVHVWGKSMLLPVTEIRAISKPEDPIGWAVRVGGQALADPEALRKRTSELEAQIAAEKRQRLSQHERLQTQATQTAQATADAATLAAQAAQETADEALNVQGKVTEVQDELQAIIYEMQDLAARQEWQLITTTDDRWTVTDSTITAKSGWVGQLLIIGQKTREIRIRTTEGSADPIDVIEPALTNSTVPDPFGNRVWPTGTIMLYRLRPGTQRTHQPPPVTHLEAPHGQWLTLTTLTFTAPVTADYSIDFQVGWDRVTHYGSYGVAVKNGNTTLHVIGPEDRVGPLFGTGYRIQRITKAAIRLTAGATITFQIFTNAEVNTTRVIRTATTKMTWIEE